MKNIFKETENFVKSMIVSSFSGHDFEHTNRVVRAAIKIAAKEGGDITVIRFGALLHDIGDYKFNNGDEKIGPERARKWLHSQKLDDSLINQVVEIVATVSFKGEGIPSPSLEGMIVQDADRLDAIGAIGIARCFAFGGSRERNMFNPSELNNYKKPTPNEYKNNKRSTLTHFYDKLLSISDELNTRTAREMSQQRHQFMTNFLDQFFLEWAGEK